MTTFLTVDEVAAKFHRSPRTIQRWARERRIEHVRIGRNVLFTDEQVDKIAAAYTVEPEEPTIEHTLPNPSYRDRAAVVVPMRRPGDAA